MDEVWFDKCLLTDNARALDAVPNIPKGNEGQLGYGNTDNIGDEPDQMGDVLRDIDLGGSFTAVSIDCGRTFSCAVSSDAGSLSLSLTLLKYRHVVHFRSKMLGSKPCRAARPRTH